MRLQILFILLPNIISAFISSSFDQFLLKYNKIYTPHEYDIKKKNYERNIERIKYHNSLNKSYKLGENQFTDENLLILKKNLFQNTFYPQDRLYKLIKSGEYKSRLFWDDYVTPVKNQGQCGSCWAFSAVGAIESLLSIQRNETLENLSEQQLIDCSSRNNGCNGGLMHLAFEDVQEMGGLALEKDYPYIGQKSECLIFPRKNLDGFSYRFIEPNNLSAMLLAIQENPLCVAIAADSFEFMFYKEGIFDYDENPELRLSHAVLLTGYDLTNEPYWKLKNSWSTDWGENGYMRLKMKDEEGVIGVNRYVTFPEFKKKIIK